MVQRSEEQNISQGLGESISASVDGEMNDLDLQRILRSSEGADVRESWRRYHLIGAALRNELDEQNKVDISAGVWAAIDSEPSHTAPSKNKANVFFNAIGKSAVAATVAVAVLVGVQYIPQEQVDTPVLAESEIPPVQNAEVIPAGFEAPRLNARVVSTNPAQSGSVKNYLNSPIIVPMQEAHKAANDAELQAYLNRLLLIHAEQSSQSGVLGVLPYARVLYPEQDK